MEFSTHTRSDEIEIEKKLREILLGSDPVVIQYMESIASQHGKRLRPKLVMIFARIFGGYDYKKSVEAACLSELFHTATLIHDDVIDVAEVRRGYVTLSNQFGNEIAVIVGDYLLAIVLDRVAKLRDFSMLDMFVETSKKLGVGVLVEISNRNNFELSVENYLRVIDLKTAVLFELCTRLGAYLGGASENALRNAAEYGKNFGMGFQVVDDLLDIAADEKKTGKPVFNDLKEGRITLPIIHALSIEGGLADLLVKWQKAGAENQESPARLRLTEELRTRLYELGSVNYCKNVAQDYLARARAFIESAGCESGRLTTEALSDLELIESGLFSLLE